MLMSKGEFAQHIGVSAGRVSQMLASGMIGRDALDGAGRNARIIVETAVSQISARRDIGQALGNGLGTRLDLDGGDAGVTPRAPATRTVDDQIKAERLDTERRKNRMAAVEEAQMLGQLVPRDDFDRELGRAAQTLIDTFTGMAPDIANAVAAQFGVPQRDVLHLVRKIMNERRAVAAAQQQDRAEALPDSASAAIEIEAA